MRHDEGRDREKLDDKVAVADRVETISTHPLESQQRRDVLPVDWVRHAGQRPRAEWQHVEAVIRVAQAIGVAVKHFVIGQQVMGEQNWLSSLKVGKPGENDIAPILRAAMEHLLDRGDGVDGVEECASKIESEV